MKKQQLSHRKNFGLILFGLGAVVWAIPFILVAMDNMIGTTKPADSVINGAGVLFITAGPLLAFIGLLLVVFKFVKRLIR